MNVSSRPGGLSGHSLIVCQFNIGVLYQHDTTVHYGRCCHLFDLDAFKSDLTSSLLMQSRPADHVDELFAIYLNTLVTLIDKHAPLCRLRITTRRSEPWFEGERRASKRLSRKLERVYRRCSHSTTARSAWQQQFHDQRRLFRRKAEDYWKSAIAEWRCDHWKLWSKLGLMLRPTCG